MAIPRQSLIAVYAALALAALVGTWSQNLFYFNELAVTQLVSAWGAFMQDMRGSPAARSIWIDISALMLAAAIWMVSEARRVGVRHVWLYIVIAFVTAIGVTFPLFLIAREYRLAARGETTSLQGSDVAGLLALGTVGVWSCVYLVI